MFKNKQKIQHILIINLVTLMFFIFDRFLKNLALSGYYNKYFRLYYNRGIAFGWEFFDNQILMVIIGVVLLCVVWGMLKICKRKEGLIQLIYIFGLGFVFWGALANLVDRFIYKQVVDYIDLSFWPVFNIADVMIVLGAGAIILVEWFGSYGNRKKYKSGE